MKRLYDFMLNLYPEPVRFAFAAEMAEVFREAEHDARRRRPLDLAMFYFNEFGGLLSGAAREQLHQLGKPHGLKFFGERSLYMQPERRFSWVGIVMMILALGVIVEVIVKGQGIANYIYQVYTVNGHTVIEARKNVSFGKNLGEWPSHYGLLSGIVVGLLITGFSGLCAWGVAHAMRRSGLSRLEEAQTWPQSR